MSVNDHAVTSHFFGTKEVFGIEFQGEINLDKLSVNLWFHGKELKGSKAKKTLVYMVRNLKKFLATFDKLKDKEVFGKTPEDTYNNYLKAIKELDVHDSDFDKNRNDLMMHIRFYGDQLDKYSMLSFNQGSSIIFVIHDNLKKNIFEYEVDLRLVYDIFGEIVDWYDGERGVVTYSLNSFP